MRERRGVHHAARRCGGGVAARGAGAAAGQAGDHHQSRANVENLGWIASSASPPTSQLANQMRALEASYVLARSLELKWRRDLSA